MKMEEKRKFLIGFLIFYLFFEALMLFEYWYLAGICDLPPDLIKMRLVYFGVFLAVGILAPILFFLIRRYVR